MDAKLTLRLNKEVIARAKEYAALRNKSLSRLIESYLLSIINKEQSQTVNDIEISPFVKSITSGVNIPGDLDYKKAYGDYLEEKHK